MLQSRLYIVCNRRVRVDKRWLQYAAFSTIQDITRRGFLFSLFENN